MIRWFWALAAIGLSLGACKKKKPPPPPPVPSARPRARIPLPDPHQSVRDIAVSKLAVFAALDDGRVEKRPLGAAASRSLADAGAGSSLVVAQGRAPRALSAARDGSLLAVTYVRPPTDQVRLYDQRTLSLRRTFPLTGAYRLLLSADGSRLIVGTQTLGVWDTDSGKKLRDIPAHTLYDVQSSADASVLAIFQGTGRSYERPIPGGHESVMQSLSLAVVRDTGERLRLENNPGKTYALSPDGRTLLVARESSQTLEVARLGGAVSKLDGLTVTAIAVSPDSRRAALGCYDGGVILVDLADPHHKTRLEHHGSPEHLAFSADGHTLYLATDTRVEVMDLP